MPWMVVGLGNPGPEYEHTRHNAGFMVVDLLGENLRANYWKEQAGSRVAVVRLGEEEELVLGEPQSFMNVSGGPVKKLMDEYEVGLERLIVVHDDIDLPEGAVRAKAGGGHGGHNGLRSLTEKLGSGDFLRVRVGVGRPPGRMDPADYVLQPLRGEQLEELESAIPTGAACAMHIIERGIDSAMREYNER